MKEQAAVASFKFVAAWRVDLPRHLHQHPEVDRLIAGIDDEFPFSDVKIVVPQAIGAGKPAWPHVETRGNLCLRKLKYSSPAATRLLTALEDALEVLSMDAAKRAAELRREILSYWAQRATSGRHTCLSIVEPVAGSRDIVWHKSEKGRIVFAENAAALASWVSREGGAAAKTATTTRLVWLDQPLTPGEYPIVGNDVMQLAGRESIEPHVRPGQRLPVLIGCETGGASVFFAVELEGITSKQASRGFRPGHPRPQSLVADTFRMKAVARLEVVRADASAVHGRSRNPGIESLRQSSVAVIGCGALGGFIARALAQSGVGSLTLVDGDQLSASNIGRHVLGMEWVLSKKATALSAQIKRDFPHIADVEACPVRFEELDIPHLEGLAQCQLIVLAGIDASGERLFDRWRSSILPQPQVVWTWLEEFALAGHAVGIVDGARITEALDAEGLFSMRLTSDWPKGAAFVCEAGCGTTYQPFAALDMMGTVNAASRLALDLLLGRATQNVVRSWLGDRASAEARECRIADAFDRSYCEIARPLQW